MDIDRMSKQDGGALSAEPRKLHKPRPALGDLEPEQVLTYLDECGSSDTSTLGETPG